MGQVFQNGIGGSVSRATVGCFRLQERSARLICSSRRHVVNSCQGKIGFVFARMHREGHDLRASRLAVNMRVDKLASFLRKRVAEVLAPIQVGAVIVSSGKSASDSRILVAEFALFGPVRNIPNIR